MGEFPNFVTLLSAVCSGAMAAVVATFVLSRLTNRSKKGPVVLVPLDKVKRVEVIGPDNGQPVAVQIVSFGPNIRATSEVQALEDQRPVERLILELDRQADLLRRDAEMADLGEVLTVEEPTVSGDSLGHKEDLEELEQERERLRKGRG